MARKHNAEIVLRALLQGQHVPHSVDGYTYALDDRYRLCTVAKNDQEALVLLVVFNPELENFIKMCERMTDEDIASLVFSLGMSRGEVKATVRNICGWCDLLYDGVKCPSGCDDVYGINRDGL